MGLIDQAAKRLEELRRTGIELPDGLRHRGGTNDALAPVRAPAQLPVRSTAPARPAPRLAIDLLRLSEQGLITPDAPHTAIAREFRVIKRPVLENAQGATGAHPKHGNLVMVTSAMAGEGKSFCAVNLAMSIAMELDSTVLLVDADVANPSVLEILGLPQGAGLLDVLTDPTRDLASVILRTNVDKLAVLPAGTRHERATELLASEAMTRVVNEMASRYPDRVIVFDSPPLLLTTESPALATHMGQIILVVEAERTTAGTVRQALATIERCPLVMTVLNKASGSGISAYSGYGYGHRDAE